MAPGNRGQNDFTLAPANRSSDPPTGWGIVCGKLDRLEEKIDQIGETLNGNGHPGLKTRMDRVEQWMGGRRKLEWLLVGVVTPILVIRLYEFIRAIG